VLPFSLNPQIATSFGAWFLLLEWGTPASATGSSKKILHFVMCACLRFAKLRTMKLAVEVNGHERN
jgi:hypothetical protein